MPEDKFAPQPPNIIIRTMESDLQTMKETGGEIPSIEQTQQVTPPEDTFLQQTVTPQEPVITPPPIADFSSPAPSPQTQTPPPTPTKKFLSTPLIMAFAGIVGLGILAALGYFFVYPTLKKSLFSEPEVSPIPSPQVVTPTPIETPSPIEFPSPSPQEELSQIFLTKAADETLTLDIAIPTWQELSNAINEEASKEAATGTFKLLYFRAAGIYLPSQEVLPMIFENAPSALLSGVQGIPPYPYAFFLYWVNPKETHLGVYFKINPETREAIATALKEWESTLPEDASKIFLNKLPGRIKDGFKDGAYKGIPLRYAILDSGFAIDYAIIDDTFVFTTHKDSMFESIRRLKGIE
jgi:hypothetical protein